MTVKLIATMVVRNEADIIKDNIDYHLSEGVDSFIVTDHRSTDGTKDILAGYSSDIMTVIHEPSIAYAQADWRTSMARTAATNGADWVLNLDADEFWVPGVGARLKTELSNLQSGIQAVRVDRKNMTGVNGIEPWYQRLTYSKKELAQPKMASRAYADMTVGTGSHRITGSQIHTTTKKVSLQILHFQKRSYAQWRQGVIDRGESAVAKIPGLNVRWTVEYNAYLAGKLPEAWTALTLDSKGVNQGWISGELIPDQRIAKRFTRIDQLRANHGTMAMSQPETQTSVKIARNSLPTDGILTTNTISALQKVLQVPLTGMVNPQTVAALQTKLGVTPDGNLGPQTVRALGNHVKVKSVHELTPEVVQKMQTLLNSGQF